MTVPPPDTNNADVIERAARAMYEQPLIARGMPFESWDKLAPYFHKTLTDNARAAFEVFTAVENERIF